MFIFQVINLMDRAVDGFNFFALLCNPFSGEVSEWLKEHAWKVCIPCKRDRGFESRSLRN